MLFYIVLIFTHSLIDFNMNNSVANELLYQTRNKFEFITFNLILLYCCLTLSLSVSTSFSTNKFNKFINKFKLVHFTGSFTLLRITYKKSLNHNKCFKFIYFINYILRSKFAVFLEIYK